MKYLLSNLFSPNDPEENNDSKDIVNTIEFFTFTITQGINFVTATFVLLLVICHYKSKQWFLIVFPLLVMIGSAFDMVVRLSNSEDYVLLADVLKTVYFCFSVSHFLFATQYLKTSLILPKILKQVKIE